MARGRGRRTRIVSEGNATLVLNKSDKKGIGIEGTFIPPNQSAVLDADQMANPGVAQMIRQGLLSTVPMSVMTKRLVASHPRILVVVHTLFRGGAEVSTIELHRQLAKMGCNQALLNIYVGDRAFHTMLADEAKEIFNHYEEYNVADKSEILNIVRNTYFKYKPDIIFYSLLREVPQTFLTIANRPPIVQVMHSQLGDSQWGYDSSGTDAVITVSKAMAADMGVELSIPEDKLTTIWNGINPDKIVEGKSLRRELRIPLNAVIVGMVGNLNDLKRPMMGLEAFVKVRRNNDYMIFAGNPSDQGNQVKSWIKGLGLERYIRILGLRDDVENVYATIDILINCSTMEGLPMTIIEGMFAKLPVIATKVGGNPEAVISGETGYIYMPDKMTTLERHLKELLRSKPLRTRMGKAGYSRACEHFHIDNIGKQYYDLIKSFTISHDELRCSVVMPVYNSERWLDRAIASVRRQTMQDFEFIIVNDGSTDGSMDIVKQHIEQDRRIRLINLQHGGIVPALNAGIAASETPLIARMDADDEMLPSRLELQLAHMDENRHVDVLGTQTLGRSADGRDMGPMHKMAVTHEAIIARMPTENPMSHPTVMFRKAAWEKVGGYKGDGRCEDYRLWVEMRLAGCIFANLEEALLIYQHTHAANAQYASWRDSILPEIRGMLKEVTANG